MTAFDLVVRNGTVLDGSGGPPLQADIGVTGGVIAAVAPGLAAGVEEIDASGLLVTPGFVDIHTHYDGQVTWSERLSPSSSHGVTTVLMGNCGVGFAPCRPSDREMLIQVMEGVEDIPELVMAKGIPWAWESFAEYLDFLDGRSYDIDIATQVPHAAVRVNVMGQRGADREPATAEELERMTAIVAEGVRAGALGVSSARSLAHRFKDGRPVPHIGAAEEELKALARGLRDAGAGVFQMLSKYQDPADFGPTRSEAEEVGLMREIVETSGRPLSFTLQDAAHVPGAWRKMLDLVEDANRQGFPIKAQVFPRPVGMLFGIELSMNPFSLNPSYAAIANLPHAEKVAKLREPELKKRLLAEEPGGDNPVSIFILRMLDNMYVLGDPPIYEPSADQSLGARAARAGVSSRELAYELMLEQEGKTILFLPIVNFVDATLDAVDVMIRHPDVLVSLGDGGAHYGMVCDSSYPTFMLTHWVRDRVSGPRISLPEAVHGLTRKTALAVGLTDRGLLAPGMKADINVIDHDRLYLPAPYVVYDLPSGGKRLTQDAEGYVATIVSGQCIARGGRPTGALPGKLVRGSR